MRIDKKLNLVIPVDGTARGTIYVHSTPISRDVFEKYFMVLSKTFAQIYKQGLDIYAGPRVAALLLRKTAEEMDVWDGFDGVENGLMSEMLRLTNVIYSDEGGWKTMPYEDAVNQKILDSEDVSEVTNALAFFTCASLLHSRSQIPIILGGMTSLWGAQTSLLNSTEFSNTLVISTEEESSGETETTLSVPS